MAATKKFDASVVTGEYQTKDGMKKRYLNVGSVMENDDGGLFLLLDRTFNPAGCPNPDGRQNVLISFFVPREEVAGGSKPAQAAHSQAKSNGYAPQPKSAADMDDDIPF